MMRFGCIFTFTLLTAATAQEPLDDHRHHHHQKIADDKAVASEPLIDIAPMAPLDDLTTAIREAAAAASIDVEPSAAWTWQHASEVLPGTDSTRSMAFYGVAGHATLWHDDAGLGQVVFSVEGNAGIGTASHPPLADSVADPLALNNILTSEDLFIAQLYWQQAVSEHDVRFRIGKILDADFFDTNAIAYDPTSGFMSLNFNQSISNPLPGYGFGANVEWDVASDVVMRIGIANSESGGNTVGFDGLSASHLFSVAELDIAAHPNINGTERRGNYRFLLWHNGIANASGTGDIDGWGGLFNFDQEVADNVAIFGRIGGGSGNVTPSTFSVSTGIAIDKPFDCQHSSMGLAVAYAKMSRLGRPVEGHRTMLEWYWRTHLTHSLYTGPVVQYVRDNDIGLGDSVIWGFRTTWSF